MEGKSKSQNEGEKAEYRQRGTGECGQLVKYDGLAAAVPGQNLQLLEWSGVSQLHQRPSAPTIPLRLSPLLQRRGAMRFFNKRKIHLPLLGVNGWGTLQAKAIWVFLTSSMSTIGWTQKSPAIGLWNFESHLKLPYSLRAGLVSALTEDEHFQDEYGSKGYVTHGHLIFLEYRF